MKDVLAVCPYYKNQSKAKIYCDGIVEGSKSTTLFFETAEAKNRYFCDFCRSFCYKGCPVAQIIAEKEENRAM